MSDKIEKLGKSVIQHGKSNNRIYLMKYAEEDSDHIIKNMESLTNKHKYTKIIAKITANTLPGFISAGYSIEATVPGFYKGTENAFFVAKYFDDERKKAPKKSIANFQAILKPSKIKYGQQSNSDFIIKELDESSAKDIAMIYQEVFITYPFPIHDHTYIKETIVDGVVRYFGAFNKNRLVGVSSAETDKINQNAEMTDFAILPDFRGYGLSTTLLYTMEEEMKKDGFKTLYTIARLNSLGMNITFLRLKYNYSGLLINNTNISGKIESMNVYYKQI